MFDAGAVVGRMVLDRSGWDDGVRKVQSDIQQLGQRVYNLGQSLTSVSRNLGVLSRNLIFFGAGILTPLIATFKSMQNYSYGVNWEITRLSRNFLEFRRSIAESMLPTIRQFNQIFADFVRWWKELPEALRNSIIQTALISGAILVLVGTFGTTIANLIKLLGAGLKLIGTLLTASVTSPMFLIVASIGGIIYAMWKWEKVSTTVCNIIETSLDSIDSGLSVLKTAWTGMAKGMWDAFANIGKFIRENEKLSKFIDTIVSGLSKIPMALKVAVSPMLPLREEMAKFLKELKDAPEIAQDVADMLGRDLPDAIEETNSKLKKLREDFDNLFSGKEGKLAEGVNNWKEEVKKIIDDLYDYFNKKTEETTDSISSAWSDFANGLGVALTNAYLDLTNFTLMAKNIIGSFVGSMNTMFSDFFYNVFTGQLEDAQAVFAEFGRSLLRIISDVISQLIVAWIIKSMIGDPVGKAANVAAQTLLGTISGFFGGHQTGIESVPHTGVYKLEEGEQVVPRYDATKNRNSEPMQIMNFITPEAVAMAMADKAGQNVIINIINTDSLRNGMTRREIYRR